MGPGRSDKQIRKQKLIITAVAERPERLLELYLQEKANCHHEE